MFDRNRSAPLNSLAVSVHVFVSQWMSKTFLSDSLTQSQTFFFLHYPIRIVLCVCHTWFSYWTVRFTREFSFPFRFCSFFGGGNYFPWLYHRDGKIDLGRRNWLWKWEERGVKNDRNLERSYQDVFGVNRSEPSIMEINGSHIESIFLFPLILTVDGRKSPWWD